MWHTQDGTDCKFGIGVIKEVFSVESKFPYPAVWMAYVDMFYMYGNEPTCIRIDELTKLKDFHYAKH